MRNTHYINRFSIEKYFYKRYANILTRIKNLAKKLYFHQATKKKTWNLLRVLSPSNTSSSTPSSLTVNNETFTNPMAITNQLNYHFVIVHFHCLKNTTKRMSYQNIIRNKFRIFF